MARLITAAMAAAVLALAGPALGQTTATTGGQSSQSTRNAGPSSTYTVGGNKTTPGIQGVQGKSGAESGHAPGVAAGGGSGTGAAPGGSAGSKSTSQ